MPIETQDAVKSLAEGSELLAEYFNFSPIEVRKDFPDEKARLLGDFMRRQGYRMVFQKWYRQDEPTRILPANHSDLHTEKK